MMVILIQILATVNCTEDGIFIFQWKHYTIRRESNLCYSYVSFYSGEMALGFLFSLLILLWLCL